MEYCFKMSTYYFEITPKIESFEVEAGSVIMMEVTPERTTKISRLASYSDRVWLQTENGRLALIKDNMTGEQTFDILSDDELGKKFLWVKLKAKELAGYA